MLLDRYLLAKFLTPFLYCVAGFVAVWLVWDLSANLPDFLAGHASFSQVARFYVLQLPAVLMLSIPVGLLLALLYTLTQMSRRNEIVSMLAAGMSLHRILLPLFAAGLLATGLLALLNHSLAPQAGALRDVMKDEIRNGRRQTRGMVGNHLYRNREDRRLWFFTFIDRERNNALRVEIIQQDEAGTVKEKWYAVTAVFEPSARVWTLQGARHVTIDGEGNMITSESAPAMEIRDWRETPWKIASSTMNPEFLGVPELGDYLRFNAEFPRTRLAPFLTHWHYRWALPWICVVVVLIAGPLGVVNGRRGIMGGVAGAIGLFAGLIFSTSLFLALGKGDRIPPWTAAWGPMLFFLAVGLYLLRIKSSGRELPRLRLPGL
jgi:lipopolysaccharide export system permease protein